MLILLALIFAVVAGAVIHLMMPSRITRGVVLAPAISTAVAAIVYTGLTWLGLAEDNPWLWAVSLLAPVVVTIVAVMAVTAARNAHDMREQVRLKIA